MGSAEPQALDAQQFVIPHAPPLCNFHTDAVETLNVILNDSEGFILPVIAELELVTQFKAELFMAFSAPLCDRRPLSSQQPTVAQRDTDHIIHLA
ncbi:hypothetical protein H4582DRAFT_2101138 [Lactarius indigo]|nr:hypothetical protein H4582DRAFT_2101138 [Lactarius indigo]